MITMCIASFLGEELTKITDDIEGITGDILMDTFYSIANCPVICEEIIIGMIDDDLNVIIYDQYAWCLRDISYTRAKFKVNTTVGLLDNGVINSFSVTDIEVTRVDIEQQLEI